MIRSSPQRRLGGDIDGAASVSGADNLIGVGGSDGLVNGQNGNMVGVAAPLLGSLGSYGGPTQTIPLLPGSPAIDAGTSSGAPTTDQRGENRVGAVDIGAFESQGFTLTPGGREYSPVNRGRYTIRQPAQCHRDGEQLGRAGRRRRGQLLRSGVGRLGHTLGCLGDHLQRRRFRSPPLPTPRLAAPIRSEPRRQASRRPPPSFCPIARPSAWSSTPRATRSTPTTGLTSLREAVAYAESLSGNPTITFSSTVFAAAQTITLSGSQIELNNAGVAVAIVGPSAGVTISGGGKARVFQVDAGVTADFTGLTVSGGSAPSGGGLLNSGTLMLTELHDQRQLRQFQHRTRRRPAEHRYAHADQLRPQQQLRRLRRRPYNNGAATLTDCTVSGDHTTFGSGGGVMNARGRTLTLTGCTLSGDNSRYGGGGLFNLGAATLTDCTLSRNYATYAGGAVLNASGATLALACAPSAATAPILTAAAFTTAARRLSLIRSSPQSARRRH